MNTRSRLSRFGLSLTLCWLFLSAVNTAQATLLNVSQRPLVLSDSVAPNLILTLDDSGSMRFAFVPDAVGAETNQLRNLRRAKAAVFNSMYYNPNITYEIPARIGSDGTQSSTGYSTSFSTAYHNGFDTSVGNVNLSNNYRVGWDVPITSAPSSYNYSSNTNYSGSGIIYRLAQNPSSDFRAGVFALPLIGAATATSPGGITFRISAGVFGCTATASYPGVFSNITADCAWTSLLGYTGSLEQRAVPAYYYTLRNNCTNTNNDDCYQLNFVTSAEQQNFANWYSFYRNRALATLSAANIAFNQLPTSVRLTWQTLNSCTSLNSAASGCGTNYFRAFAGRHRGNFYSWLSSVTFDNGTPLRAAMGRAGEFLRSNDAWAYNPNPFTSNGGRGSTVSNPQYACRPSYQIMMTDGMWNGADGNPSTSLHPDQSNTTLPDGRSYGQQRPFYDSTQHTLADLAFHYWATDASNSLSNDLKPYLPYASSSSNVTTAEYWDPRNDPATWQHLVNYTVGLGLSSSLTLNGLQWNNDLGTFGGNGYDNLRSGARNWPAAAADDSNNVYDLWHAAINSRGEFFSVDDPDAMVQAFRKIISRIGDFNTSASAPAVVAAQVDGATRYETYESEFSSEDWSGDVKKFTVASDGTRTRVWSAKQLLQSSRTVYMAASSGTSLQPLIWSNLSTAQQAAFNINPDSSSASTDSNGQARLNYVLGSRSNEGTATGSFRTRSSVLGDIVNSAPVLVHDALYLPYMADRIDGSAGTYAAFATTQEGRTPMIYVGANDGMLHGFNANTGRETFAFAPTAVIPNLYRLSGQSYRSSGHRFYVDGSPVVSDVYYGGAWHTVLVGTLGGGGRSLFALDVTDPNNIRLLWEFSHADLGYTFAQPTIARLHNGRWAVVTGNGYGNQSGSTADRAALFVLDIQNGTQLTPNQAPLIVSGDTSRANGLSSVRLADNNSDGIADYAYAGDLQGNLWRFDLFGAANTGATDPFSNISNGTIRVSYGGRPLFTAVDGTLGNPQAITAPPSLVRHPSQIGYLVMFGTGKYFEDTDGNVDTTRAQTIYAIWDRKTKGESTGSPPVITRASLLTQTITTQASTSGGTVRLVSQNTPQWYRSGTSDTSNDANVNQWGWKLDLAVNGSRTGELMTRPMAARGQSLFFSTLTPNSDPCAGGVESWLYGINPYSGGRTTFNVMDINGDGEIDSGDFYNSQTVSGRRLSSASGFTLSGSQLFSTGESLEVNYGPASEGRQTWQVIPETEE